jgi:octaprenyl-diphosphate synthase
MGYANSQMENYQNEAFALLNEFPENSSRDALEQLIRFTTERKK